MKSLRYTALALTLAFVLPLTASAQKFDVGLQSAIVYQALDHSNDDGSLNSIAPGFQNAVGNLTADFMPFEGGRAHLGLLISS